MTFEYPDILRQDAGTILTKFHNGGSALILTWWAVRYTWVTLAYRLYTHWPYISISYYGYNKHPSQYDGVLLGEHLGQLFTIIWTVSKSAKILFRIPDDPTFSFRILA